MHPDLGRGILVIIPCAEGGKRPGETRDWEEREESVSEDSLQGANTGTLRTPVLARPQPMPKAEYQANNNMQYKCSWDATLLELWDIPIVCLVFVLFYTILRY